MKKNKKTILFIIIIIVVIIITVPIIILLNKKNISIFKIKKDDNQVVKIEDETLNSIMNKIPFIIDDIGLFKDAYNGETITIDKITPLINILLLSNNYEKSYLINNNSDKEVEKLLKEKNIGWAIVYLKNDINDYLINNFNIKLEDLKSSENVNITNLNDKYVAFTVKNIDEVNNASKIVLSKDYKVEDDTLTIYEKCLFVINNNDEYYIYKNSNIRNNEPLKIYENLDKDELTKSIYKDFINESHTFKHIFKKNSKDNYYWLKTEYN